MTRDKYTLDVPHDRSKLHNSYLEGKKLDMKGGISHGVIYTKH